MRISRQAQSTLEYVTVAALIMTGIFIMGPYTIRAINAQFQGSSDQVKDSFKEVLEQAPPTGKDLPDCDCTNLDPKECGNGNNCPRTERVYQRDCRPIGCEVGLKDFGIDYVMMECHPDDTCCTDGVWTGRCGVTATRVPGGRCSDGYGEMVRKCGSPPTDDYICSDGVIPECQFDCLGRKDDNADWCDPAKYNLDLPGDLPILHSNKNECPPSPTDKCMAECQIPFVASTDRSRCTCGNPIPIWDGPTEVTIHICGNVYNVNIGSILAGNSVPLNVTVRIYPEAVVGSTSSSSPALAVEGLPGGSVVTIINEGRIEGRGGRGGRGSNSEGCTGSYGAPPGESGGAGGDALRISQAVSISNASGEIWGGGGGGGGATHHCTYNSAGSGGGGAGFDPGGGGPYVGERDCGGQPGQDGTQTSGGNGGAGCCGFNGGRGGDPGARGDNGQCGCSGCRGGSQGGGAGAAIQSNGNPITWFGFQGDVRGAIN